MNMDCFLKRFSQVLITSDGDALFESFKIWLGGTTSIKISKLLNFAVSQMDQDECYVETGVYTGCTLVSSFWANAKKCYGIDPYGEGMPEATTQIPEFVRDQARRNISQLSQGVKLIEKDFRNVTPEEIPEKIAVSFIDAKHDYVNVTDNLKWLEGKLASDALIFFDDINYSEVSRAIVDWWLLHRKNVSLICWIEPFYQDTGYISSVQDRVLNNGLVILRVQGMV